MLHHQTIFKLGAFLVRARKEASRDSAGAPQAAPSARTWRGTREVSRDGCDALHQFSQYSADLRRALFVL